ncbi:MAG: recombinase family protein [Candidatus Moranbacteria bacterium]|nr:recombinase family protein [Candidatus Moranbacteria bacterium]
MDYIAYYRVSTDRQGKSGLGLGAQQKAVKNFINESDQIIESFTDIESGKNDNRIELAKALDLCNKHGYTLLIARLDRLSRNLSFIATLMDSNIKFKCCDMPEANEFTIHIFGALAQQQRKYISDKTKQGLAIAKERGVKLGKIENLTAEGRSKGQQANKINAKNRAANMVATEIIKLRTDLNESFSEIARILNNLRIKTVKGAKFYPITVSRLYHRMQSNPQDVKDCYNIVSF